MTKYKIFLSAFLLPCWWLMFGLLVGGCVEAPNPEAPFTGTSAFVKIFGDESNTICSGLVAFQGGYLVAGVTGLTANAEGQPQTGQIVLFHTDTLGNLRWQNTLPNPTDTRVSFARSVTLSAGGNLLLTGAVFKETGQTSMFFQLADAQGTAIQRTLFGAGARFSIGNQVIGTSEGGAILMGSMEQITGADSLGRQMLIVRANAQGQTEWQRIYGFDEFRNDDGNDVLQEPNGELLWVGTVDRPVFGQTAMRVVRTNSIGNLIWDFQYGLEPLVTGLGIVRVFGGFVLMGTTRTFAQAPARLLLVKIDPTGRTEWIRNHFIGGAAQPAKIILTDDGGIAVTGQVQKPTGEGTDIFLFRADPLGEQLWLRRFGSQGSNAGVDLLQAPDGGFVIGGTIFFGSNAKICLIKTDPEGRIAALPE